MFLHDNTRLHIYVVVLQVLLGLGWNVLVRHSYSPFLFIQVEIKLQNV